MLEQAIPRYTVLSESPIGDFAHQSSILNGFEVETSIYFFVKKQQINIFLSTR